MIPDGGRETGIVKQRQVHQTGLIDECIRNPLSPHLRHMQTPPRNGGDGWHSRGLKIPFPLREFSGRRQQVDDLIRCRVSLEAGEDRCHVALPESLSVDAIECLDDAARLSGGNG